MLEAGLASSVLDAMNQPYDMTITILSMRGYAKAVERIESDDFNQEELSSPYMQRVWDAEEELLREQAAVNDERREEVPE